MVNGLCLLESVQGVGFSYCIPNKVHTILANEQKQIFLYTKNAQFASKKGTGNSNLEQTVIFMELFVLQIKIFQI